jgi:hypothetical protein
MRITSSGSGRCNAFASSHGARIRRFRNSYCRSDRRNRRYYPLLRGHYDIALLTYEKFAAIALTYPHVLRQAGVVVIDEAQMIADESRIDTLEVDLCPRKAWPKTVTRSLWRSPVSRRQKLLVSSSPSSGRSGFGRDLTHRSRGGGRCRIILVCIGLSLMPYGTNLLIQAGRRRTGV